MKNYLFASLIVLSALLISCGEKKSQLKTLESDVIEVHDEIMPKMKEMLTLRNKMVAIGDSLGALGNADSSIYYAKANSLLKADAMMMDWMHGYEIDLSSYSEEEAIKYLENEKNKISEVKKVMLEAMADANQ